MDLFFRLKPILSGSYSVFHWIRVYLTIKVSFLHLEGEMQTTALGYLWGSLEQCV